MKLVGADAFTLERLAALFTAGYEGYAVPIRVDRATLGFMVDAWDIDLARSRVAVDGEEPVGVALLGVRGGRGWIGGLGVVAAARRRGTGRALMEAVLEVAPPAVTLEVIEQNEPALRLYEALGFVRTRMLEVWTLEADVGEPEPAARSVELRPLGQTGLPWQRQDPSLPAAYERLEVDDAAVLVRITPPRVSVLQLAAGGEEAAARVLAAARSRGSSLHYVNVPEGDPAARALGALGGRLDLRQVEMERRPA